MKLQCNIGETDKIVRWTIGIIIIITGFLFRSWWGLLGLLPILTAVFSFCWLYTLLGISTCKEHPAEKNSL
jgi:hypothetical protein